MQIDNNMKNELLSLNNEALKGIITSLAKNAGVSSSNINISESDLSRLRLAIQNATDKDANEALKLIGEENAKRIIKEYGKRKEKDE